MHEHSALAGPAEQFQEALRSGSPAALNHLAILARQSAAVGIAVPLRDVLREATSILSEVPAETCYWIAHALLPEDTLAATDWFVRAMRRSQLEGDLALVRISSAAALVSDLIGLQRHDAIAQIADDYAALVPAAPDRGDDASAHLLRLGRLCAAYASRSTSLSKEEIDDGVLHVQAALRRADLWPTEAMRVAAATALVDFAGAFIELERARDLAVATSNLIVDAKCARLCARWWAERGWLYATDSDGPVFRQCVEKVEKFAAELDDDSQRFSALRLRCAAALRSGRTDEGLALLPCLEQLVRLTEAEARELSRLKAAVLIMCGRARQALEITTGALRLAQVQSHVQVGDLVMLELEHAHALAAVGELAAAADHMRGLAQREYGKARERLLAYAHAYDWQRSQYGDAAALRASVEAASRGSAYQLLLRDRGTLSRLCDAALRAEIEPEFVRDLIARRRLDPPPFACEGWPWAVRIETLGGFRLYVQGELYRPEHKAQDKVLELLKLLVGAHLLRRGEAEQAWLCDELWPDADPGRARKSLETCVARLRRLLRDESAVIVGQGRVRLAPHLVWSDVSAFVEACARIKSAEDATVLKRTVSLGDIRADLSGLLSLYSGPFLHGDLPTAWILGARAQMSRLLRQSLLSFAQVDAGEHPRDLLLALERAHVADPSSEEIAQMLMRHHMEQANHAEALRVYRRTRDTIQSELGASPSPQMESLGRQVFMAVDRDATAAHRVSH